MFQTLMKVTTNQGISDKGHQQPGFQKVKRMMKEQMIVKFQDQ